MTETDLLENESRKQLILSIMQQKADEQNACLHKRKDNSTSKVGQYSYDKSKLFIICQNCFKEWVYDDNATLSEDMPILGGYSMATDDKEYPKPLFKADISDAGIRSFNIKAYDYGPLRLRWKAFKQVWKSTKDRTVRVNAFKEMLVRVH